jgi:hypothetical protein
VRFGHLFVVRIRVKVEIFGFPGRRSSPALAWWRPTAVGVRVERLQRSEDKWAGRRQRSVRVTPAGAASSL